MIITSCRDNIIYNLDTGRPDEMIRQLYAGLDAHDRVLFQDSLFVGIEMEDKVGEYTQGDFLMRSVLGVDPERGAMAVGTQVEPYQVVQFHLRDKRTSADDLKRVLADYQDQHPEPPEAVLMFECVGRGKGLYGEPHRDSKIVRQTLGPVPIAGAFCNGEIGPVSGRTFVHGYTSVMALFRRPRPT